MPSPLPIWDAHSCLPLRPDMPLAVLDRHRAAGGDDQRRERLRQAGRHDDGVRRRGDIDQRAVDIEEEGPAIR